MSRYLVAVARSYFPKLFFFALILLTSTAQFRALRAADEHALDPLTAGELLILRDVLAESKLFSEDTNFAWIQLKEPPKASALSSNAAWPRTAKLDAIDYVKRESSHVLVDLTARRIISIRKLGDQQPALNGRDWVSAMRIIDSDPAIRAALAQRGLKIPGRISDVVRAQFMPVGNDENLSQQAGRLVRVLFFADQNAFNEFSTFIDGIMVVVDLFSKRIVGFKDEQRTPSIQTPNDIFDARVWDPKRKYGIQETAVATPAMPASAVFAKGNTIDWRNWNLRFGFNLREGLVLHQIAWNDGNRLRSIAYRASVAEVATIYGDPDDYWSWMEVFDEGVLGLGYLSVPVKPGREIPATAATLNTLQPDAGEPRFSREMPDRIYLYERDAGNLFYSRQSERLVHYRGTELVVGFVSALGNYTYNFSWIFRSDGSFGFEVELAGQIATKFGAQTDRLNAAETASELPVLQSFGDSPYGTCVSRGVLGVNHQHWFSLRIDFDIDGTRNAAAERNLEIGRSVIDGRERVGLSSKTVSLQSARDAKRSRNDDLARSWIIYSSEIKAIENKISGYEIVPKTNTVPALPAERQNTAPAFAFHHFWVTPYRDDELYAAGEYPNQARREGVDNLYYYANDDSVLNTDIVAWYTLGVTHIPRPEDFPLMPASRHSVLFQPFGFLSSQ